MSWRSVVGGRPLIPFFFFIYLAAAAAAVPRGVEAATPAFRSEDGVFKWGYRERVRQEYLRNGIDLDNDSADDRNYIRIRSQLWCTYEPFDGWKLHAMACNENRRWFKSSNGLEDKDFEINEFIFENLYLSAENIGGTPVSVTAGRQDIPYGEGFVFMDGGPLDGSRTRYFNAVRVKVAGERRSLELHYLSDPWFDRYLPTVNCQRQPLIELNEKGAGLYYTDTSLNGKKIEAYYMFKRGDDPDGLFPDRRVHTVGTRVVAEVAEGLSFTGEGALQFGDYGQRDISAAGGYLYGRYAPPLRGKPSVTAGFLFLSGNDADGTGNYGGWDPLYGRWPKWTELYIYTLVNEGGVAYWSNIFSPYIKFSASPIERVSFNASLFFLGADEDPPSALINPIFGSGSDRGILSAIRLNWKINRYLSGHLLWEHFEPGDFYNDGADAADFLRWEIFFSY